jgi:hypothetical protein
MATITQDESAQIEKANASGRPPAMSRAAFKKQGHNPGVTEHVEVPGRGHSLTIDHGWREVAEKALDFVKRFGD